MYVVYLLAKETNETVLEACKNRYSATERGWKMSSSNGASNDLQCLAAALNFDFSSYLNNYTVCITANADIAGLGVCYKIHYIHLVSSIMNQLS